MLFSGTSSAAPVVSGIAGLAFAVSPGASPAQIEQALESSAVPIAGVVHGRVDAYGTVRSLAPAPSPTPTPSAGSGSGQAAGRTVVVRGRLTRTRRSWSYGFETPAGVLDARVTMLDRTRAPVQVRLVARRRVLGSARGRKVVDLQARVPAGRYRLLVRSAIRSSVRFRLVLRLPG